MLDIDKAWNGIGYLLQEAGGGPVDIVDGGAPVSDGDRGYGPARYLTAPEDKRDASRSRHAGPAHMALAGWLWHR